MEKSDNWKAYVTIGIILLVIAGIYFLFFFHYSCDDLSCFYGHQEKCVKTKLINNQEDTTWLYTIKGQEDNQCKINVEVLAIKIGTIDKKRLEGKNMDCYSPIGSMGVPGSDISKCHGELKEEMQNLIIQKLHQYIVGSTQDIGEELANLLNSTDGN